MVRERKVRVCQREYKEKKRTGIEPSPTVITCLYISYLSERQQKELGERRGDRSQVEEKRERRDR